MTDYGKLTNGNNKREDLNITMCQLFLRELIIKKYGLNIALLPLKKSFESRLWPYGSSGGWKSFKNKLKDLFDPYECKGQS